MRECTGSAAASIREGAHRADGLSAGLRDELAADHYGLHRLTRDGDTNLPFLAIASRPDQTWVYTYHYVIEKSL